MKTAKATVREAREDMEARTGESEKGEKKRGATTARGPRVQAKKKTERNLRTKLGEATYQHNKTLKRKTTSKMERTGLKADQGRSIAIRE